MVAIKKLELAVGVFVALGLVAFFMLAMKVSNIAELGEDKGYKVTARFESIGGLKIRAPVSLAGVRIGRVANIGLDTQTYEAVVTLSIDPQYDRLPTDSSASILTSGLLGEQYVGLEPGGMDTYLKNGSTLKLTQSALVLEKLIARMITGAADSEGSSKKP
ncbi:putative transport protein (ABC superfamily,peri_bind) [Candidatus Competibacter denitrificans Run_A_D11]|uniref:Transport protein (ABC superfamily,peri_bind) n=1 Tax=Candidatus Competibacter denitrificans Run_A_D11 TaxID=1400863 RepID=W6M6F3_9GAMM|nr:outer membrane lipid asymmetry maintenance protein MlaD [Candidatus Competibacter denitrificans]CDI01310.1 putative transport protein (ABC superfamily,peri_bind) [Candidatus Competibacter denitrificans Run_A_D11]HRC68230.1 outer membrane lipid asymmetry maintenance protein MlaD [Candidatus Competibacter denitrificans]